MADSLADARQGLTVVAPQGRPGAGFSGPSLSAMKTPRCGNFSNSAAGLPKLVASTSGGFPATHCDRSIAS